MKVTLFGAASGEVTGSAYLVESGSSKVLIDFGMFQGVPNADQKNRVAKWYTFRKLNSVLVTHAHLDHTGRLPILAQRSFAGPVYCTKATAELTGLILRDAARIQENDILRVNRHRQREAKPPTNPLYSTEDVEKVVTRLRTVEYNQEISVAPGIEARWFEAGHLLGSASIQLTLEEDGRKKTVVFSGDLGPSILPFTRSSETVEKADAVFLESTYGDRNHRPFKETALEFAEAVRRASEQGGKILVPTFAVGRAQLLVVLLAYLFRKKEVKPFPVYLDSPMAIEAAKIYMKYPELWHDRLKEIVRERPLREELAATKSKVCVTPAESRALNEKQGTCMILAGAGMCNAGRILHHLRNNVWKPETSVVIVGYQGHATIGRALVEGAKDVRIFGERIAVRASVRSLGGFSAHAGQSDLLNWLSPIAPCQPRVFLTHGEDRAREPLAACIEQRFGIKAALPGYEESVEL
jgi:metallo-beta-lactamase family protein